MPNATEEPLVEQLDTTSRESFKKLHELVDDLKSVEEHEKTVLEEDPLLFRHA
jgi:hypothetical protein